MASRNFNVDESIELTLHRKAMWAKKYWSSIWEIPGSFLCFSKLHFAGSSAIVFKVMYYLIYDPPFRRTISSEDFEICWRDVAFCQGFV